MSVRDRARQAATSAALKAAEKAEGVTGESLDDEKRATAQAGARGPMSLMGDNRGQMAGGASRAVDLVVALVVGGLMAAFLLPIAIDEIAGVETADWDNGAAALWGILPVMIVLAVFLFFVGVALSRS